MARRGKPFGATWVGRPQCRPVGHVDVNRRRATSCPTDACCSTRSPSGSATAPRSRWSAPTAPARPRCCGSSPATSTRTSGTVDRSGGLGVMRQFVGSVRDDSTVRDLLLSVAPPRVRAAAAALDARRARDDGARRRADPAALRPGAVRLGRRRRLRGRGALGRLLHRRPSASRVERAQWREVRTLSGGEQKRLVLEALLRGPDEVLLLDEPDNYLDVPGKRWLEERAARVAQDRAVRLPRPRAARAYGDPVVTSSSERPATRPGCTAAASRPTTRPARTGSRGSRSCAAAGTRSTPSSRRSCCMYRSKAAIYNDGMASRLPGGADPAAQVRGGRPAARPRRGAERADAAARRAYRQAGGRLRRELELTGLMKPFDLEVWYGERVAVLGSQRLRASRTSCGCSPSAAATPTSSTDRSGTSRSRPSRTRARPARRPGAARLVRPDPRAPRAGRAHRCSTSCGAATSAAPAWAARRRRGRCDRYELAHAAPSRPFESLSGGQQARLQILLLELSGATLLLLDEPTDNLDLASAEALEEGLDGVRGHRAGRHPRPVVRPRRSTGSWSSGPTARSTRPTEPVWDEGRVERAR